MAKITIDDSLCTGCGLCAANCPDSFEIGDDSLAHVVKETCTSCDIQEIVEMCPLNAIRIG